MLGHDFMHLHKSGAGGRADRAAAVARRLLRLRQAREGLPEASHRLHLRRGVGYRIITPRSPKQ